MYSFHVATVILPCHNCTSSISQLEFFHDTTVHFPCHKRNFSMTQLYVFHVKTVIFPCHSLRFPCHNCNYSFHVTTVICPCHNLRFSCHNSTKVTLIKYKYLKPTFQKKKKDGKKKYLTTSWT